MKWIVLIVMIGISAVLGPLLLLLLSAGFVVSAGLAALLAAAEAVSRAAGRPRRGIAEQPS